MKTITQPSPSSLAPTLAPAPVSIPPSQPAEPSPENPTPDPQPATAHKRRGKIACLPKELRSQLNTMLDDGATCRQILRWLATLGHTGINDVNLHNWRKGGYQDWLHESDRLDRQALRREWLAEHAPDAQPAELFPILDQLCASQMLDTLFGLDTASLKRALATRPRDYIALLNALSRFKRDAMKTPAFQKFLEEEKQRLARKKVVTHASVEYICQREGLT